MVLNLSERPPPQWTQYFRASWKNAFYAMKRRADIAGSSIEIVAMPEELKNDHLPELEKAISEANANYRAFADQQVVAKKLAEEAEERRKKSLADLKSTLKFD